MLDKRKQDTYRAVCELRTARKKVLDYLSVISRDYYMKDVPPFVIRNLLMLCSNAIIKEDNYRALSNYELRIIDSNGILKYNN